ncbi:MAG TPA: delta-aminolevulinic acid dehydratase [Thermoanaerobaculia bacterium]|nr:delta-aminolevulinic acid dehydratase [Thermoanaerobaculia bacterium]
MNVADALEKLDAWIEQQQFRGWDPHDALNSPFVRALTFGNRYLGIAALQAVKRSPINLRPLLGVRKGHNPKAMGLFLASYARKYAASGDRHDLDIAVQMGEWLIANVSPGFHGACWGYNFDWPNRAFYAHRGTPTVVNTAFNGLAFVDAARLLSREVPFDAMQMARSACDFILRDLNIRSEGDEVCFSYTPGDQRCAHNANVLGGQLLAEVSVATGDADLRAEALRSARFTARRQRPDGSWPYGTAGNDAWVDNFHTAYVIVALHRIGRATGSSEFDDAVERGRDYWLRNMFTEDGVPMYYAGRLYPIDIHAVAEAILAFLDLGMGDRAWSLAGWAVENMQDEAGFFHFQIHRRYRIRTPFIRWSQAWMQRALTELSFSPSRNSRDD